MSVSEVPLDMFVQTHTFVLTISADWKEDSMYPLVNLTRVTLWTSPVEPHSHGFYMSTSAVPTQPHNMKTCCGHTLLLFFSLWPSFVVFNPCAVAALIYPENEGISLFSVFGVDDMRGETELLFVGWGTLFSYLHCVWLHAVNFGKCLTHLNWETRDRLVTEIDIFMQEEGP